MIERYRVTILYTAPTAIRTFIKWGDQYVDRHDLSSLRLLGTVGEGINPGGLDVVPREDRRRALPDRRYLVADRDRRHHDEPAARRHGPEARQLHQALARHRSRSGRRGRQAGARRRRRLAGHQPSPGRG